ncbi:MAG: carotenoid biosynthesis protein [Bacteroidota bacterium]|jgi:putative membrane protein|nr:carotenoid biosynthesis protein [Bacteroidota bacterium]
MQEQKNKTFLISAVVLVIVHLAGLIALHSKYHDLFLSLTPFNLILSTLLLLINHKGFNRSFIIFILIVSYCGYLIEVVGVRTGWIFGHYWYEETLGWTILYVPAIISLNWFILVYSAGIISNKVPVNIFIKCGIGALLLVILDMLIEQSAPKYHFWSWLDGIIPLRNYIAWFIISFIFLLLFHRMNFNKQNKLAPVLYLTQLVFFALLYFWN